MQADVVWQRRRHRLEQHAVTAGIDVAFLVVILLELYHTTLSRGPISQ